MKSPLVILFLLLLSCRKEPRTRTFVDDIPFASAITTLNVTAGQDIVSRVKLRLYELRGNVTFREYYIEETQPKQFDVRAKALYSNWNENDAQPVIFTIDTVFRMKTTTPGKYIMRFFNGGQLFRADTVLVN